MINPVGATQKFVAKYDQQRFFAERAAKMQIPKTYQIGAEDKISISSSAMEKLTYASAEQQPAPAGKAITYEDPRKEARQEKSRNSPEKTRLENITTETRAATVFAPAK